MVFLGFWVSKKAATRACPYGYERAEDLAGLGVALVIWASAAFAGYESYHELISHTPTTSIPLGMTAASRWEVTSEITHHLMDGIGPGQLTAAEQAATTINGVQAATARGRWMGRTLILDLEAHLDPALSLAAAQRLTSEIDQAVYAAVPEAGHVHAHPSPARPQPPPSP